MTMVSQPSLLDRTEIIHFGDGTRQYLVPGAAEAAARSAAYEAAYTEKMAENERAAAVVERVKQIVEAGPSETNGDVLERHLTWLSSARRQSAAAQERRDVTAAAALQHHAAMLELAAIEGEVAREHSVWATSLGDDEPRSRP
jgi:hypothetical protein